MKNPFLVYQAKSFYNAFILLEQTKVKDDELLLVVPRLVYGSFSVEVTLKAILTEQGISYGKEHNLKALFEKLPFEIQNQIWCYLLAKAPEYSDTEKRENELILISNAFVNWRYCFEPHRAPALDSRFLDAFANAAITVMFELGYNVFFEKFQKPHSPEEDAEIDRKFEENRRFFLNHNQGKRSKKGE